MATAYLSLGSNLGDRLAMLAEAVRRLGTQAVRVTGVSSVYETAPWGKTDQPAFLNLVVELETDLDPHSLLRHILAVEQSLGRVRLERWGPRTVDIDILLYDDEQIATPDLEIPHPRMADRAFVLVPLLEIAPHLPFRKLSDEGVHRFLGAEDFRQRVE